MNNKALISISLILLGLPVLADYTVQTEQPLYPNYPYTQPVYNQYYTPNYYQNQYPNQYQYPYSNYNYGYNAPYRLLNSGLLNNTGTTGNAGVLRNLGQSVIFSMLRGY